MVFCTNIFFSLCFSAIALRRSIRLSGHKHFFKKWPIKFFVLTKVKESFLIINNEVGLGKKFRKIEGISDRSVWAGELSPHPHSGNPPSAWIWHINLLYIQLTGLSKYQKGDFTSSPVAIYQKSIFNCLNPFANIADILIYKIFSGWILDSLEWLFYIKFFFKCIA